MRNSYFDYLKIYTDGAKNKQECVGVYIHIPDFKIHLSKRLTDRLSVYTAEIVAVIIALQWVEEVRPDRVVICTDTLAIIKSIADKLAKKALLKVITVKIPLEKGEGKAVVKRKGLEIWQKWWEEDRKGRKYYRLQKSVSIKNNMRKL